MPPCSTRTFSGFITPGLIPAAASWSRAGDGGPGAGEVLQLRLVRVQLRAEAREHGDDHQPDSGDRDRAAEHEARPASPGAVFGMAAVDEPLRHHPDAVDPRTEYGEQRRQQRQRREHRDDRDQHPADAHPAQQRQRQDDHRQQADRHGRAGDDHRVPGVRHRLDERRLDVVSFAQLVAEAEDHQQRVVDRDAEADERDQELHDDRDVRDVGQRPDERERVEDRRDSDDERHQDRGQRPEDEEEDDQRAEAADQRLQEDARASVLAVAVRLVERVATGHVDGDPGREAVRRDCAHLDRAALLVDAGPAGQVDLLEGGMPVVRNVGELRVEKYELVSAPGFALSTRAIAARTAALFVMSPLASGRRPRSACARQPRTPSASAGPSHRPACQEWRCSDTSGSRACRPRRRRQGQHEPDDDHRPAVAGREVGETAKPTSGHAELVVARAGA